MVHYQQNSLGFVLPGIETKLLYPYSEVSRGRSSSYSTTMSTASTQESECWVQVCFNFTAEHPDELTLNVCTWIFVIIFYFTK